MGVDFDWLDEDKTIMRYVATSPWNWKDYYRAIKISAFRMHNLDHQVDVILDLRQSEKLPAGAVGHLRGFGKPPHKVVSGRAVILGVPPEIEQNLTGETGRILNMGSHTIYFADDEKEAIDLVKKARMEQ